MNYQKIVLGLMAATSIAFTACQEQTVEPEAPVAVTTDPPKDSVDASGVPQAAATAFQARFPKAQSVAWSKASDDRLVAEFTLNGQDVSAYFQPDGTWQETEVDISEADLPDAVRNTLASQFADYSTRNAEKVATPQLAEAYEVILEKGDSLLEVVLDASGKVLTQETIEAYDE